MRLIQAKLKDLEKELELKYNEYNQLRSKFKSAIDSYSSLVHRQQTHLVKFRNLTLNKLIDKDINLIVQNEFLHSNFFSSFELRKALYDARKINNNRSDSSHILFFPDDFYDISLPNALDYLPHLKLNKLKHSNLLIQPKLKKSKNRRCRLSIGIPTVRRNKSSYLLNTLGTLFGSMSKSDRYNTLIIVLIAEV